MSAQSELRDSLADEVTAVAALQDQLDGIREKAEALLNAGVVVVQGGYIRVPRREFFALADTMGVKLGVAKEGNNDQHS